MRINELTTCRGGRRAGRRGGFTLVEVLVVLLIASIILTILATVLSSSMEILRTGESRSQLNASARNALDYLVQDVSTASDIPLSTDRDLNGYDDGDPLPADGGNGYNLQATWRVAHLVNNIPVTDSSMFLSEAYSDHLQTEHNNRAWALGGIDTLFTQAFTPPKVIANGGTDDAVDYKSLFRLALPANSSFPYYLGKVGGTIYGYPEEVPVGTHKETAALIEDLYYHTVDKATNQPDPDVHQVRQMPIASNITAINFGYYQEVPVYESRINSGGLQIAYQNLNTGDLNWVSPNADLNDNGMYNSVPVLDHYELRQIDVAFDNSDYTDGPTNAHYGHTFFAPADQYPEGYDTRKLDGSNTTVGTHFGLQSWNCSAFYDIDSNGDDIADNAPIDRLAFVTTSVGASGQAIEGGSAALRPDMSNLLGGSYYQYSTNPTGVGDFGDADGIPDGDGVPDDPVPAWWLPFLRAVRVTVTATPRDTIDERRARSGKAASDGTILYYRLDSPVPYIDPARTQPAPDRKRDYVGPGRDIILTKMVPVNFAYKLSLATDPQQYAQMVAARPGQGIPERRVEFNYFRGADLLSADPYDPSSVIKARDSGEKYYEKTAP
jgi:prepilin-type N-terminal cleavage/methylation domain-containing protein